MSILDEQLFFSAASRFEAAREMRSLPGGHRMRRLHGHGFVAKLVVKHAPEHSSAPGGEVEVLRTRLEGVTAAFDYRHLNQQLDDPSDENLARAIRRGLDLENVFAVRVQSTAAAGFDLDEHGRAQAWRRYAFEAAHRLPNVAPGHKCGRMHGHGFGVALHAAAGEGDARIDHDRLDAIWQPLHARLDHACLNDVPGLENPTSEMIAGWIFRELAPRLPALSRVTVYETRHAGARFDGSAYGIWKEMTLDSAVRVTRAPDGDRRRGIHGHTYTLRLHLHAPLDATLGWIVDFGDVKARFDPIFRRIDHQPLYELSGVDDSDAASLARWIAHAARAVLPELARVDLHETPDCGATLAWGERATALLL